jgi:hypothetical protein
MEMSNSETNYSDKIGSVNARCGEGSLWLLELLYRGCFTTYWVFKVGNFINKFDSSNY